MPKSVAIHPNDQRRSAKLTIDSIPINAYGRSFEDETKSRGADALRRVQRDMQAIRSFESMLDSVKKQGHYQGVEYVHKGPAHLSIGQEASAVGQALALGVEDVVFGSHRSHGEILAKGLSAIAKLPEDELRKIMETNLGGDTLRVVDDGSHDSAEDLAIDFLLYGTLAEIFGREAGFNRGMGGSMHAFFVPFGVYPNNAIVGGSSDIGVGAALFKLVNQRPGISVVNVGDAAAGCGPTWEALCFATMDQFRELWEGDRRRGLPLVFNFVNNFYGMGGQPVGETMGFKVLARIGAGLNPENVHAERIDGYDPLAVADAYDRKRAVIDEGRGPTILDTITYRYSGHSPSDASSYREREEVEEWQSVDSIQGFGDKLVASGLTTQSELEKQVEALESRLLRVYKLAIDLDVSPRTNLLVESNLLERTTFTNGHVESFAPEAEPEIDLTDNPRLKSLANRSRSGFDAEGQPLSKARTIQFRDALFESVLEGFQRDSTLVAYGEENRDWGGAFAVYRGLTEALPYHRLFNTTISEGAIVGTAVGYALSGGRVIAELMYCDFMGRAGDEIFNQLAKWQAMSGGELTMPVILRVSVGSKYGAQHSQDWSSLCAHVPGLKVCFPATPYDAKGMMTSALLGTDPVVFFESQRIYDVPELFREGGVPEERYEVPIGVPDVKRTGSDVTILSVGAALYRAIEAADELAALGVSAEVVDARSLVPFDYAPLLESVVKTRRLVCVGDACERGSWLHTVASTVGQTVFDELDAPPTVVGARNWITPPDELEEAFFPFPADILDAIHARVLPLKGYTPTRPADAEELVRRAQLGV